MSVLELFSRFRTVYALESFAFSFVGFAQCSLVSLFENKFSTGFLRFHCSLLLEIFRNSFIVIYCLIINVLCVSRQLIKIITSLLSLSTLFFYFFSSFWTCASVGAFSEYHTSFPLVNILFLFFKVLFSSLVQIKIPRINFSGFSSAEGGIRTHVPFRTNGFQDRLVMTSSIPLQKLIFYMHYLRW